MKKLKIFSLFVIILNLFSCGKPQVKYIIDNAVSVDSVDVIKIKELPVFKTNTFKQYVNVQTFEFMESNRFLETHSIKNGYVYYKLKDVNNISTYIVDNTLLSDSRFYLGLYIGVIFGIIFGIMVMSILRGSKDV